MTAFLGPNDEPQTPGAVVAVNWGDYRVPTYLVTVKPWAEGWELHVEGVGVTQARKPAEAETMVRDLIRLNMPDVPANVRLRWQMQAVGGEEPQPVADRWWRGDA